MVKAPVDVALLISSATASSSSVVAEALQAAAVPSTATGARVAVPKLGAFGSSLL